jgi:hypothetical protein
MNTRNKGALAEYRFISTAISLDLKVLVPAVEGYAYDCIIDNGKSLYKIQIKYASKDKRLKNVFSSMLHRRIKSTNPTYRKYEAYEVDFYGIYIWYIDTFYLIPFKAVEKSSITLDPKNKNNKYDRYKNNWELLL